MIEVKDETFPTEVERSDVPVVVDFWAAWCGPCKAAEPMFKKLAEEMSDRVKFVKVNVDDAPGTAVKCGIRSIPTFLLFDNGEAVSMMTGARTKDTMKDWLNGYLNADELAV